MFLCLSPPHPFLCFWRPLLLLFSFSNLFFPSQADSYPFLPYGLEEFPNGHSDLYHAARKLWVLFSSSSSFCPPPLAAFDLFVLCDFLPFSKCLILLHTRRKKKKLHCYYKVILISAIFLKSSNGFLWVFCPTSLVFSPFYRYLDHYYCASAS